MSNLILPETSHVGLPFRKPSPPPGIPAQRLPSARYHVITGDETLYGLAQEYYGNPRRSADIYNANRANNLRADRVMGFLSTMEAPLPLGSILLIP